MLSRCIYGARITLPIAMFTVAVAILTGGTLGVLCAYFGGQFDNIMMRFMDIWGSIPGLMLSIAIVAALGNNMYVLVIGLAVGAVPNMARTFRGPSSRWWTATMWSPPNPWEPAALTSCSSTCCPMRWVRSSWPSSTCWVWKCCACPL